eukprot:1157931-Pelagomonas_calceolata.AAC.2
MSAAANDTITRGSPAAHSGILVGNSATLAGVETMGDLTVAQDTGGSEGLFASKPPPADDCSCKDSNQKSTIAEGGGLGKKLPSADVCKFACDSPTLVVVVRA